MKAKKLLRNFLLCGMAGWCVECFWTGLGSLIEAKDRYMFCRTSIWMFPIYGMAAFLEPLCKILKNRSRLTRGIIYAGIIYVIEFCTGIVLKYFKACPWDYSHAKYNFKGVIRFDYAPMWIIVGLILEHILCRTSGECQPDTNETTEKLPEESALQQNIIQQTIIPAKEVSCQPTEN